MGRVAYLFMVTALTQFIHGLTTATATAPALSVDGMEYNGIGEGFFLQNIFLHGTPFFYVVPI